MKKIILLFCIVFCISSCTNSYTTLEEANKNNDYEALKKVYSRLSDKKRLSAVEFHNLGNLAYIFWTQDPRNISLLETSKKYFEESLFIRENDDTRYNYDIVVSLLKKEKKETQEATFQNDQNLDKNSSGKEPDSKNDSTQGDDELSDTLGQIGENSNYPKPSQNELYKAGKEESAEELTEKEKERLEKIAEELSKGQREYQQFFGKQESNGNNSIFDQFFSDSFFFSEIDEGGEKDW